jgi:hypothetical protein
VLLDGFKRYRCARQLQVHRVPFVSLGADEASAILELLGQGRRSKLNVLEEARFLDELKARGMSLAEIAQALGRSKAWVSVRLGLLEAMSPTVRQHVFGGALPASSWIYTLAPFRRLLLIRLFQQATSRSVGEWLDRRFQRLCVSFSCNSPARKLANNISPSAVGRMASCVRAVEGGVLMNW